MPEHFPPGSSFSFQVRCCPIVRQSAGSTTRADGSSRKRFKEVDALLLHDADRSADGSTSLARRRDAYASWLQDQFRRHGGATIDQDTIALQGFRLVRLQRKGGPRMRSVPDPKQRTPRTVGVCGRPDALLSGTLTITDGDAFQRLLARGIGRHRAFGFGMLLLKPA